jgi:hypothetical protein
MRLVEDWKKCWKWLSVWLAGASAIAMQLYEQFPAFKTYIPDKAFHHVMTALIILIIVGRLIKQNANPQ